MGQGVGSGMGRQKFMKYFTLSHLNSSIVYRLSMFPCIIISDANYFSITCNSNYLFWPLPRCNEDPDCRNPRGFRKPIKYKGMVRTFHLFITR